MKIRTNHIANIALWQVHLIFIACFTCFNIWFNHRMDEEVSLMTVFLYSLIGLAIIYLLTLVYYAITLPKLRYWGVILVPVCFYIMARNAHLLLYEVFPNIGHQALNQNVRDMKEFLFMNSPRFFYYSSVALLFVYLQRSNSHFNRALRSEKEKTAAAERAAAAELEILESERRKLEAERKADEMELRFWGGYSDPHFLKGELHAVSDRLEDAATTEERKQLKRRLELLTEIAEYSAENVLKDRRVVVFEKEFHFLKRYLEFRDLGSEGFHQPIIDVIGEPSGHRIVPMALVYLAEGAFKHGDLFAGPLEIRIGFFEDRLEIRFRNRIPAVPRKVISLKSGLTVVKRRLELALPGEVSWWAGPEGDYFEVRIVIHEP